MSFRHVIKLRMINYCIASDRNFAIDLQELQRIHKELYTQLSLRLHYDPLGFVPDSGRL